MRSADGKFDTKVPSSLGLRVVYKSSGQIGRRNFPTSRAISVRDIDCSFN